MNLQQIRCPACAAPMQVVADSLHTRCPYCGATINVERSAGEATAQATAQLATQVSGAIAGANAQMQAALVLIPVIGWLWQLVELGFFAGTPRANRYGA